MDTSQRGRAVSAFEVYLTIEGLFAGTNLRALVRAVSVQDSCLNIVFQVSGQHRVFQILFQCRIPNGRDDFDATIKIASHPVGGSNVDILVASVFKIKDATVLKKTAYDTSNVDRLRKPGDAGA